MKNNYLDKYDYESLFRSGVFSSMFIIGGISSYLKID